MDGVTVKQAVELLKWAKNIKIALKDSEIEVDRYDHETLELFGDCICASIMSLEPEMFIIEPKTTIVRKSKQ